MHWVQLMYEFSGMCVWLYLSGCNSSRIQMLAERQSFVWISGSFLVLKAVAEMLVAQPCPTLSDPTDSSSRGSSVQGILQRRILQWVAMSSSRRSSWPRDQTQVSCIARRSFYHLSLASDSFRLTLMGEDRLSLRSSWQDTKRYILNKNTFSMEFVCQICWLWPYKPRN